MNKNKIIRLITSLLISIALWVYVINVVNPSSTTVVRNIPVSLTGLEILQNNGLAIEGNAEYTVDVTIKGTRKDLATLSADNVVATADVSSLTLGQDYISVTVTAPSGYSVSEIRSRKIQVYVDNLVTKEVPVTVIYDSSESGIEPTTLSLSQKTVKISGAEALVNSFGSYEVEISTANLAVDEPVEQALSGTIKDTSGNKLKGVTVSAAEITVNAVLYHTKTVELETPYTGNVWKEMTLVSIDVPTSITIKGPSQKLEDITKITTKSVSIEGISEDVKIDLVLNLPDGVYLSNKEKNPQLVIDVEAQEEVKEE